MYCPPHPTHLATHIWSTHYPFRKRTQHLFLATPSIHTFITIEGKYILRYPLVVPKARRRCVAMRNTTQCSSCSIGSQKRVSQQTNNWRCYFQINLLQLEGKTVDGVRCVGVGCCCCGRCWQIKAITRWVSDNRYTYKYFTEGSAVHVISPIWYHAFCTNSKLV